MPLIMVEKLVSDTLVLDVRGRLVLGEETEMLREGIKHQLAAGHKKIVLNLEELSYIDSSGLSTLISAFVSVRNQGGQLKLLRLTSRVSDLLQITKLSTVFEIYESMEEVQRSFSRPISA